MVAEVVLSPLLVGGKTDLVARFAGFVEHVDRAAPVVLVGLAGLAGSLRRERIQHEWPWLVVIGWFSAQILLLDYDAPPDAFPWLVGLSVGVGFGVAALRRRAAAGDERAGLEAALHVGSRLLPATLLALTLVSVATMGSYGVGHIGLSTPTTYDTATELEPDLTRKHGYNGTESQYVYWNRVDIDSCRAFGAKTQRRLVTRTGMGQDWDWQTAPCGQFGPVWDGVVEEFGLPQWLLSRA